MDTQPTCVGLIPDVKGASLSLTHAHAHALESVTDAFQTSSRGTQSSVMIAFFILIIILTISQVHQVST